MTEKFSIASVFIVGLLSATTAHSTTGSTSIVPVSSSTTTPMILACYGAALSSYTTPNLPMDSYGTISNGKLVASNNQTYQLYPANFTQIFSGMNRSAGSGYVTCPENQAPIATFFQWNSSWLLYNPIYICASPSITTNVPPSNCQWVPQSQLFSS